VPEFVIFSDKSLRDMAARCPTDSRTLLEVEGMTRYKAEKFGPAFLEAISEFLCE